MHKNYVLDSNILIEDEKCIKNLINGDENKIYIPNTVIEELDKLKDKKSRLKERIFKAFDEIENHKDEITILFANNNGGLKSEDNKIINEILNNKNLFEDPIFITNDKILRYKAYVNGILTEEYKRQIPFKHVSEEYTGFIDIEKEEKTDNCFYWKEGKLYFYSNNNDKQICYENEVWRIKPYNHYQNCMIDLITNDDIDLVTIQSEAGKGKSFISIASAFHLTFQKKLYDKIYIIKSNYEIGNEIGYLPGNVNEKMLPYFKPVQNLVTKLTKNRELPKKCYDEKNEYSLNPQYIEFLPINYLRGMDFDNCVIICEEIQNLSRADARSLFSRMGNNVKCICTGDISQIDNPYLSKDNNAMNWAVKLFKGASNYGHIVLKGKNSRGPICKLVVDRGL